MEESTTVTEIKHDDEHEALSSSHTFISLFQCHSSFFFIIFGCCTHMYNSGLQIMLLRGRTCRQLLARRTQRSDYWVFLFKIRNLGLYSWV